MEEQPTIHHLKDISYYEDLYDRLTVDRCRRSEATVIKAYNNAKQRDLSEIDPEVEDPQFELYKVFGLAHWFATEWVAGECWEERQATINEWMERDKIRDDQIESAQLKHTPLCKHCHSSKLRVISKDLMQRLDDKEEALFLFECLDCQKRTAMWHDGRPWEKRKTPCPDCNSAMEDSDRRGGEECIITTYTCPSCKHSYEDALDLKEEPKKAPDPDYEKDKARFCFDDKRGQEFLKAKQQTIQATELMREMKERVDNKDLYDKVANIQKPTVHEVEQRLIKTTEAKGYAKFSLDNPTDDRYSAAAFSVRDAKSDRGKDESVSTLEKLIKHELKDSNWRLMSDGVNYRVGMLTGRLRIYEAEEDLIKLVSAREGKDNREIPKNKQKDAGQ